MWPEEAAALRDAERKLTELRAVGPYTATFIERWLREPPDVPRPPAIRDGFRTYAEARSVVDAHPVWRAGARAGPPIPAPRSRSTPTPTDRTSTSNACERSRPRGDGSRSARTPIPRTSWPTSTSGSPRRYSPASPASACSTSSRRARSRSESVSFVQPRGRARAKGARCPWQVASASGSIRHRASGVDRVTSAERPAAVSARIRRAWAGAWRRTGEHGRRPGRRRG